MFLKPNMMIPLIPERKEYQKKNMHIDHVYMIDVDTKEVYLSPKRPEGFSPSMWIGFPLAMIFIRIRSHFYLEYLSVALQVLLAILVVAAGALGAWVTRRMIYTPQREDYFKQYPWARKVDDMDEVMRNFPSRAVKVLEWIFLIGFFFASVYSYIFFVGNMNLITYVLSLAASFVSGAFITNAIHRYHVFRLLRAITRPKA